MYLGGFVQVTVLIVTLMLACAAVRRLADDQPESPAQIATTAGPWLAYFVSPIPLMAYHGNPSNTHLHSRTKTARRQATSEQHLPLKLVRQPHIGVTGLIAATAESQGGDEQPTSL